MAFICQGCSTEYASWTGLCPKCGSTRVLTIGQEADPLIGRVIAGKYRILKKLGEGGMGAVYEGELEGIGQRVALKFLNQSFQRNSKSALRFLNEAKGLARLSHPNTVTLHDFGQDEEGHFFISMELVEGVDLHSFLGREKRLSVEEAVEVVLQVADALGDAHSKGVIHRDIKPENIMVKRRPRGLFVKVLDFGLARMVETGTSRLTNAGTLMGSLRYMSPEQATGREIDSRADIYSLGIVLFELLTGRVPFDAENEIEILAKHKETPMPHLWEFAPGAGLVELDAVIQRATAKDPAGRYPSMEGFSSGLSVALKRSKPSEPATLLDLPAMNPEPSDLRRPAAGPTPDAVPPRSLGPTGQRSLRPEPKAPGNVLDQNAPTDELPTFALSADRRRKMIFVGGFAALALVGVVVWMVASRRRPEPLPPAPLDQPTSRADPLPPMPAPPVPSTAPPAPENSPTTPVTTSPDVPSTPTPVVPSPEPPGPASPERGGHVTHPASHKHHTDQPPNPNGIVTPREFQ